MKKVHANGSLERASHCSSGGQEREQSERANKEGFELHRSGLEFTYIALSKLFDLSKPSFFIYKIEILRFDNKCKIFRLVPCLFLL